MICIFGKRKDTTVVGDSNGDGLDKGADDGVDRGEESSTSTSSRETMTSTSTKKTTSTNEKTTAATTKTTAPLLTILRHPTATIIFHLRRHLPKPPSRRTIVYHQGINERVGATLLLQVSETNGMAFHIKWWALYLPTIEYIGSTIGKVVEAIPRRTGGDGGHRSRIFMLGEEGRIEKDSASISGQSSGMEERETTTSSTSKQYKMAEWIRSKTGSMGIQGSAFHAPEPPYYSCNTVLSFSGFYYGGKTLRKLCTKPIVALGAVVATKARRRRERRELMNGGGDDRTNTIPREILSSNSKVPSTQYGSTNKEILREEKERSKDDSVDVKLKA